MSEEHWAVFKSNLFGVWSLNYQFPILNSALLDVWFQGMTIAFDLRDNWVPGDMFTPRQPYWSTCSIFFIHFFTPHPIFVSDPRETEVTPLDSNNWKLRWSGIYCFHEVVWRLEMGTWTIKDLSLLFCCCCCCAIVFVTVSWNSLVPHYRALIDKKNKQLLR